MGRNVEFMEATYRDGHVGEMEGRSAGGLPAKKALPNLAQMVSDDWTRGTDGEKLSQERMCVSA